MNYRHAYHAGNFADVVKHLTLVRTLIYMQRKDRPFRYIDTHAGSGHYRLDAAAAECTGEWREGIARLWQTRAHLPPPVFALAEPYMSVIASMNQDGELKLYPGSARFARDLMRPGSRMDLAELHPDDFSTLKANLCNERRVKLHNCDGFAVLKSLLPVQERRALVLVDPPYEAIDERRRIRDGLAAAFERAANTVALVWYPIKDQKPLAIWRRDMAELAAHHGLQSPLAVEIHLRPARNTRSLNGAGMLIFNPPYVLEQELSTLLRSIGPILAPPPLGLHLVERLDRL